MHHGIYEIPPFIYWLALRSCPHLPGCFWKRRVFLPFSRFSTLKQHFVAPETQVFVNGPEWNFQKIKQKNAYLLFSCGLTKTEVSLNTMMSYVTQRMPFLGLGFYPTIVLAFSCGRTRRFVYTMSGCELFWKRTEWLRFRYIRTPTCMDRAATNIVSKTVVSVGPFP